ncbi:MAG: hypothetical protein ING82_09160 [Roseomonas sp.]|nr:hypothetical protein [Roseomonas sp.]
MADFLAQFRESVQEMILCRGVTCMAKHEMRYSYTDIAIPRPEGTAHAGINRDRQLPRYSLQAKHHTVTFTMPYHAFDRGTKAMIIHPA